MFAWCLHSRSLLWWFFFFLWRSCWSFLENSTSSPFLQDSRLAVSRCVPAASISSLLWWSTVALFLWSYTVGYFMWPLDPNHLSSCLLWKLFRFFWSFSDTPQVSQLYNSTLFTNFWYSQILVVRFFFQISFQIALFFARATAVIFFLLWMSFQSPSFDPSFITFPYSLSSSLDPLFTVVYSVFSSVCAFHYVSWLLIIFQTAVFTSLAVIFLLSLFAPVMNFLMWFMFSLLKCFMKCGSMIFWTSCGCDTYRS